MNFPTGFENARVLVIGDVMLDRYWWGDVSRISPEAPVPIVRLTKSTLAAGGAANVAANIAGLGATPMLVGCVGADSESELLRSVLKSFDISTDNLIAVENRQTTVKTRVVAHSQQVARVDQESSALLDDSECAGLLDVVMRAIENADAVVLSDYAKGVLTESVVQKTIAAANSKGIPVIVDPKGRDYTKYRGAFLLTPNRKEAADACGLDETNGNVVAQAGKQLLSQLAVDSVLITQGEDGMTLFTNGGQPHHLAAMAHEVYDVTGAGDTVIATLATALAAKTELETAAFLANAAAGVVVQQVGTTPIRIDELRRALDES